MAVALGVLRGILQSNKRANRKNLKKAQKNLKAVQGTVQDSVAYTWAKAQDTIQTSVDVAQAAIQKNSDLAQKKLNKAQKQAMKNLATMQSSVVTPSLLKAQDVLTKSSTQAGKGLMQAASSAKDVRDAVQDQYTSYVSKRKRARAMFRWGLVIGVVLAILYAPVAGSELRSRLAAQWQNYRSYFGA
jgi:gas vesicle protein